MACRSNLQKLWYGASKYHKYLTHAHFHTYTSSYDCAPQARCHAGATCNGFGTKHIQTHLLTNTPFDNLHAYVHTLACIHTSAVYVHTRARARTRTRIHFSLSSSFVSSFAQQRVCLFYAPQYIKWWFVV